MRLPKDLARTKTDPDVNPLNRKGFEQCNCETPSSTSMLAKYSWGGKELNSRHFPSNKPLPCQPPTFPELLLSMSFNFETMAGNSSPLRHLGKAPWTLD